MQLSFFPYLLKNSATTKPGTLLKVTEGSFWGVADLICHPELGEATYADEIKNRGSLFLRTVELAKEDLQARKQRVSLLCAEPVKNNYLVTDVAKADLTLFAGESVKIKGGTDIRLLSEKLNASGDGVKIRLDFNSKLSQAQFENFLNLLTEPTIKKIEYIEDPTVICESWRTWNRRVPLAFDFQQTAYDSQLARYRILKPCREAIPRGLENFTLTSSMGHSVGLAHGLRIAQQLAVNDSGFLTLDVFEDDGFHRYFEVNKNRIGFTEEARRDHGIGMTDQLNRLEWTAL